MAGSGESEMDTQDEPGHMCFSDFTGVSSGSFYNMVFLRQSRKLRADQNHSFLEAPPDSQISATNPLTYLFTILTHLLPSF